MIKVGVLGATGYVAEELIRLLYNHKEIEIIKLISSSKGGENLCNVYRNFLGYSKIILEEFDLEDACSDIDVLFSCLPYGVLMEHLTKEILYKVRIIDLGVDYRFMTAEEYKTYYNKEHKSIELSHFFEYGLSEWNRENIEKAYHIANPGCFATAMELALLPLIKEDMIEENIIIDGKCSLSGSGRTLTLGTHFIEANESVKPYKIINHPHALEAKKAIDYIVQKNIDLTFVPHIVPMQRGMLVTCYTKLKNDSDYQEVKEIYNKYYSNEKFIEILKQGMYVETKWVKNSNMCHINFEINKETNTLIIFSAIDNLIKGAAGQALQNFNIMYGLEESMGLDFVPLCI